MKLVLTVMAVALLLTGCVRYRGYDSLGGALPSGSDYYYQSPGSAD